MLAHNCFFTVTGLVTQLLERLEGHQLERLHLIVATNLPFEQWTDVLGSERLTGALLDRLRGRAANVTKPSYSQED